MGRYDCRIDFCLLAIVQAAGRLAGVESAGQPWTLVGRVECSACQKYLVTSNCTMRAARSRDRVSAITLSQYGYNADGHLTARTLIQWPQPARKTFVIDADILRASAGLASTGCAMKAASWCIRIISGESVRPAASAQAEPTARTDTDGV
jgi:hypothetical protein